MPQFYQNSLYVGEPLELPPGGVRERVAFIIRNDVSGGLAHVRGAQVLHGPDVRHRQRGVRAGGPRAARRGGHPGLELGGSHRHMDSSGLALALAN